MHSLLFCFLLNFFSIFFLYHKLCIPCTPRSRTGLNYSHNPSQLCTALHSLGAFILLQVLPTGQFIIDPVSIFLLRNSQAQQFSAQEYLAYRLFAVVKSPLAKLRAAFSILRSGERICSLKNMMTITPAAITKKPTITVVLTIS